MTDRIDFTSYHRKKDCRTMASFSDWRVLAVLTALLWGTQMPVAKPTLSSLGWRGTFAHVILGYFIVSWTTLLVGGKWQWHPAQGTALAAGLIGGLGSLAFYKAMDTAHLSTLIPITAQYVLVSAAIGVVVFREPLTVPRAIGVVLGVIAVILLSMSPQQA